MKKELFIHFAYFFAFFVFVTLFRQYFNWAYVWFWLGGVLGTILPDIDHIIYVYVTSPHELTSQRVDYLVKKKDYRRATELLYETRGERGGLIFHTIFFQLIFLVLTFWMMSSSNSLFGRGLVLAFALHLSIDQIADILEFGNLNNWLKPVSLGLTVDKVKIYWFFTLAVTLVFGFFM